MIECLLGVGLTLLIFHQNTYLPMLGYGLIYLGIVIQIIRYIKLARTGIKIKIPNLNFLIPFLVLLGVTAIQFSLDISNFPSLLFMVTVILVFLLASNLKPNTFNPLIVLGMVLGISAIIKGSMGNTDYNPMTAGYNMTTAILILSCSLTRWKYRWILITIALPGAIMTGANEAIVALVLVTVYFVITNLNHPAKSFKFLAPIVALLLIILPLSLTVGNSSETFKRLPIRLEAAYAVVSGNNTENNLNMVFHERVEPYKKVISNIIPIGHGYDPQDADYNSIHSVPLRVLYELGPIGLLTWLWIISYGFFKTKWKYTFLIIFSLTLFDSLMWSYLALWLPAICGIVSNNPNNSDNPLNQ